MRSKCLVDGELSQGRKGGVPCGISSASHCCHEYPPSFADTTLVQKM